MSHIYVIRRPDLTLTPAMDEDVEKLRKWKVGTALRGDFKHPRNYKFLQKFFVLLRVAFENQDRYDNFQAFRDEITMRCGFYHQHKNITGQIQYWPDSISFASMDEIEFAKLYEKAIDLIIQYFIPGALPDELEREVVSRILQFS